MGKRLDFSSGLDTLDIKTGIDHYRSFTFLAFAFSLLGFVLGLMYTRTKAEIIVSLFLSSVFLLCTIYLDERLILHID